MEFRKENWNEFVLRNNGSFLQSWEWGEFQRAFGRRVFRLGKEDWVAQFIEIKLPLGKKYWYCPRGPVIAGSRWPIANSKNKSTSPQPSPYQGEGAGEVSREFVKKIQEIAKKEKVMFFRIGPEWEIVNSHSERSEESPAYAGADKLRDPSGYALRMTEWQKLMSRLGFRQLNYDIEPSQTLILDINKSEDELLAKMHEKTRYNIHLAERKGVKIKMVSANDADFEKYFEEFYKLTDEGTAARKEIRHHPKEYYRKQLEINPPQSSFKNEGDSSLYKREVGRDFESLLFVAEYENQVIAANVLAIFGKTATYLHGATGEEHREIMAPHLLQWEQIRYAKSQGCGEYDFWGIVNEHTLDRRGKSWEGFTRFKKGFGGREVNYIGYWDYPLDKKWYLIYRGVQKFRR